MRLVLFLAVVCITVIVAQVEASRSRSTWRRRNQQNSDTTTPRPGGEAGCPEIECPDQTGICPYGPNQDENLCPLCGCLASRRCGARPMCMMACPNGFQNGPDGCPTCRCYDPPQTPTLLVLQQESQTTQQPSIGHHSDRRRPAPRGRGNATSPTAAQLPAVRSMDVETVTSQPGTCPPMCMMYCEHGFKRDRNGCSLCECNNAWLRRRSAECVRPMCAMFCEHGFRSDARGCTICQCYQPGTSSSVVAVTQQCPQLRCHHSRRRSCAFGYEVDADTGCQSCVCRQTSGA